MAFNNLISRTDAAALIPEDVSNLMLTNLQNESVALDLFTRIPVAQSQSRFPVISALPTAAWVNGDTGLKQTTEVNWANKYINIEELATIVPIPDSVAADAAFDLWGAVRPLLEQAIGRALDAAIFFGTNAPASFPTNIVAAAVAAGNVIARGTNAAAAGGIATDISQLLATIEADGYDANTLVGNTAYKGRLRDTRDTNGVRNMEVDSRSAWGVDIAYPMRGLWPTGLSAAELIALEREQFILGVRQDFTYKMLTEGVIQDGAGAIQYNLAQQDMTAMRLVFRVGWQVANPLNYDQATEASRYPAAVLRSPAV